jgi:hypothetical protein
MDGQRHLLSTAAVRRDVDGYRRPILPHQPALPPLQLAAAHPIERYGDRRAIRRRNELRPVQRS